MTDVQLRVVGWDVVEDEIRRSYAEQAGKRLTWSKVFGKSLSKRVAMLEEEGKNKQEIYKCLSDELALLGVKKFDVYRKLLIGVSSRTSENESRDVAKRHVAYKCYNVCPHCKGTGRVK